MDYKLFENNVSKKYLYIKKEVSEQFGNVWFIQAACKTLRTVKSRRLEWIRRKTRMRQRRKNVKDREEERR
jgi:hypothetical protein